MLAVGSIVRIKRTGDKGVIAGINSDGTYHVISPGGALPEGSDAEGGTDGSITGNNPALKDILDELEKGKDELTKKRESKDREQNLGDKFSDPESKNLSDLTDNKTKGNTTVQKEVKEVITNAIKDANAAASASQSGGGGGNGSDRDYANELLGDSQLQQISSLFSPRSSRRWDKRLDRILQVSDSYGTKMDYNTPSKKDEDILQQEIDIPVYENVLILLDCSTSMGATKFLDVIDHLAEVLPRSGIRNARFFVVFWGTNSYDLLAKDTYGPFKGSDKVKQAIMKGTAKFGSTYIFPALLHVANTTKLAKMDLCLVLTDGEFSETGLMRGSLESYDTWPLVNKVVNKGRHRGKFCWIICSEGRIKDVTMIDRHALKDDRIIHVGH